MTRLTLEMSDEEARAIREAAARNGRSVEEITAALLRDFAKSQVRR